MKKVYKRIYIVVFLLILIVMTLITTSTFLSVSKYISNDDSNILSNEANDIVYDFNYTGDVSEFTVPKTGIYKIELWGAQGNYYAIGNNANYVGKGAYTSGKIQLDKGTKLYFYVGGHSHDSSNYNQPVFNNTSSAYGAFLGHYSSSGGGATDVRYFEGNNPSEDDLKENSTIGLSSRIMVAGAGGGNYWQSDTNYAYGGNAGGLTSYRGINNSSTSSSIVNPSSQTESGDLIYSPSCSGIEKGTFGKAGNGCVSGSQPIGGSGGSGYIGGTGAGHNSGNYSSGGAGGSSYISGHTGCVAIKAEDDQTPKDGCSTGTSNNECSKHYSGLYFTETKMIDGSGYVWTNEKGSQEVMPNPNGGYYSLGSGQTGNGFARITYYSGNSYLNSLTFSTGTLDKTFNSNTYDYTVTIGKYVHELTVSGTTDSNATINGLGIYELNGSPEPILIYVTDSEGYVNTYTVNVVRTGIDSNSTEIYKIVNKTNNQNIYCESNKYNYEGLIVYKNQTYVDLDVVLFNEDATYTIVGNEGTVTNRSITIVVSAPNASDSTYTISFTRSDVDTSVTNYSFVASEQVFEVPVTGEYKIELWGAQGGTSNTNTESYGKGGAGAYTSGVIYLTTKDKLYIYTGGEGKGDVTSTNYTESAGYNGGGFGSYLYVCAGGGGATDVRLNENDIYDRVMVAAGGGGDCYARWSANDYSGGYGGALKGGDAPYSDYASYRGYGATQLSGTGKNDSAHNGSFYQGCNSPKAADDRAGGGGGYYGGSCSYGSYGGGGGGSSFISGHLGCIAKDEDESTNVRLDKDGNACTEESALNDITCSIHYSNRQFYLTEMKSGNEEMPNYSSSSNMVGNYNNGYARITPLNYSVSDNYLRSLTFNKGTLDKEFSSYIETYTLTIPTTTNYITATGTVLESDNVSVTGLGEYVLEFDPEPIHITVTAEDGSIKVYTINIERAPLVGHTSDLYSITNKFTGEKVICDGGDYDYDIKVYSHLSYVDFDIVAFDNTATWSLEDSLITSDTGVVKLIVSTPKTRGSNTNDVTYNLHYSRIDKDIDVLNEYSYTGSYEKFVAPINGTYMIELWGAQGGDRESNLLGGPGAYTSGVIKLNKDDELYFYVGSQPPNNSTNLSGGYNGGGNAPSGKDPDGRAGGGATDVRYFESTPSSSDLVWNSSVGLRSRIMVAAGGGGAAYENSESWRSNGGAAGGISGYKPNKMGSAASGQYGTEAYQTSGGYAINSTSNTTAKGQFGIAGSGISTDGGSGGGSGYYGGGGSNVCSGGGGGSSFISGHLGCVAISSVSSLTPKSDSDSVQCTTSSNDINCSIHYSGKSFIKTTMIDGMGYEWTNTKGTEIVGMPTPSGDSTENGHTGNGYARITQVFYSNNNLLSSLTISKGSLDKTFDPAITDYTLTIDYFTRNINVNAVLADNKSVMTGDGNYFLDKESIDQIQIFITAEDGSTRTYTININRLPLSGHSSKLYTITDATNEKTIYCDGDVTSYDLEIYSYQSFIDIETETYDPDATVTINNRLLSGVSGTITIEVRAPGVTKTVYSLNYVKSINSFTSTLIEFDSNDKTTKTFVAPANGYYQLEAWGASGGMTYENNNGGLGAYATGHVYLEKNQEIYITVGEKGYNNSDTAPFNNSGATACGGTQRAGTGGGSTSITIDNNRGVLRNYSSYRNEVLLVAAGGGGASNHGTPYAGGNAGGIKGNNGGTPSWGYGNGGTQSAGGTGGSAGTGGFGYGGTGSCNAGASGGSGFFGGGGGWGGSGGGGSSYIANSRLIDYNDISKHMTCYSCTTSDEASTLTNSVSNYCSSTDYDNLTDCPIKNGNGLVRITNANLSNDNFIIDLISNEGTFDEEIDPFASEFNLAVDTYTHRINLEATLSDPINAKISGLGDFILELNPQSITFTVTAHNGDIRTYTINIRRKMLPGHSSKLYSIYTEENEELIDCERGVYNYDVTVYSYQLFLTLDITPYDEDATYVINNNYLINSTGTFEVVVSAPDVSDTTYYLHYEKTVLKIESVDFDYTGDVQTYTLPNNGMYKLEVWGAQGGTSTATSSAYGGYGAYAVGAFSGTKGQVLYVYVGGQGLPGINSSASRAGGYNGGGGKTNPDSSYYDSTGGGASHIATSTGLLATKSDARDEVLIVAGGGGGGAGVNGNYGYGGNGGGIAGNRGSNYLNNTGWGAGGTQTQGGCKAGYGGSYCGSFGTASSESGGHGGAGGGGWYGGGSTWVDNIGGGGGGSSYIGNELLVDYKDLTKTMYCYSCTESEVASTYTISNNKLSENAVSEFSKLGNGFARISTLGLASNNNFLSSLNSDKGYFDKDFSPTIQEYTLYIDLYDHDVTLSGVLSDSNFATEQGLGKYELSVKPSPISIVVTADSGDIRTYTVNIVRKMENGHSSKLYSVYNATRDETFNFEKDKYNYDGLVIYSYQVFMDLIPRPFDEDATWEITGNELILQDGTITIKVKAPGVQDSIYTIDFTRVEVDTIPTRYDLTEEIQSFTAQTHGYYKIEAWGAQGGGSSEDDKGGYGAYATGLIYLEDNETIYVNVGGTTRNGAGGYGYGGGSCSNYGGGGATAITYSETKLNNLSDNKSDVILVAAGGGGTGSSYANFQGGHAGGVQGNNGAGDDPGYGASQNAGGRAANYGSQAGGFGYGGYANHSCEPAGGGGAGWYGGSAGGGGSNNGSGGGGSSYIANPNLINREDYEKHMTCYNCTTSEETGTKTYSVTDVSSDLVSDHAKKGNGGAFIGYFAVSSNNYLETLVSDTGSWSPSFNPVKTNYQINVSMYTQDITISGTTSDKSATAVGFGKYDLEIGYNEVPVTVTAQDGSIKIYNITVLRENLKGGHTAELMRITNTKNEEVIKCKYQNYRYEITVYSYQTSISLDILPYDPEATWIIKGNELILESGVVTIEVSAPGNLKTTYYLDFTIEEAPLVEEEFSYKNSIQEYKVLHNEKIKLEVWGAQGGNSASNNTYEPGYGSYSVGYYSAKAGETLYVVTGGQGARQGNGGYNGGGKGSSSDGGDGGGATHVATRTGLLSELEEYQDSVLIVAGGGGGNCNGGWTSDRHGGGSAGGYVGNESVNSDASGSYRISPGGNSANKTYQFGKGQNARVPNGGTAGSEGAGGGGGGYYGGESLQYYGGYSNIGGGGGTGYIGNEKLLTYAGTEKHMTCYNCLEFEDSDKLTISTEDVSDGPIADNAKKGNGFVKITAGGLSDNNYLRSLTSAISSSDENQEEVWDKEFNTITFDYRIDVDPYTYEIYFDGEPYADSARVNGLGRHHLSLGSNEIPITVTAEDGSIRTYTLNVVRNKLDHPSSELMQYNLDGAISEVPKGETEFDVNILSGVYQLDVEGIPFDENATVTYSGFGYIKTNKTVYIIVNNPKASPSQTIYKFNITKGDLSGSYEFDYTGTVQTFDVEFTGFYQIEVWGAQGGNAGGYVGGYGAYSTGIANLKGGETLYLYVGGQGKSNVSQNIVYSDYNWTYCAGEGGTCNAPAGALIAYGERSTFAFRTLGESQTSISCSNGVFGDPLGGVVKKCMYTTEKIKTKTGDNTGGFNGGGNTLPSITYAGGGGGATHISSEPGTLNELSGKKGDYNEETLTYDSEDIIIVAGGGGGAGYSGTGAGGSAGGYLANYQSTNGTGYGASQTAGGLGSNAGSFGQGGERKSSGGGAGGGGFFGGGAAAGDFGGGGGSGFIGSKRLKSIKTLPKHMTCYNCSTTEEPEIYTESTTRVSSNPTTDYAKSGNGFIKITVLNLSTNNFLSNIDVYNILEEDNPIKLTTYKDPEDGPLKTYEFNLTVDPDMTDIRFAGKPEDSKADIDGFGDFDVPVGTTPFEIIVTAENGDELTYTINVTREADTNNKPEDITITGLIKSLCSSSDAYCKLTSNGTETSFDPTKNTYEMTVPSRVKQLKWNVNKNNKNQIVTGDGITLLNSGTTRVTIEIESEYCVYHYPELNEDPPDDPDETYTPVNKNDPKYANCFSTYTYDVTRIVSDDADLIELFIDNKNTTGDYPDISEDEQKLTFDLNYTDPDVFDYFFSVPNEWDHIKYLVAKADAETDGATVDIVGNENFVVGESNLVTITVTAPDRTTRRNYRLHVYRELSQNVYIKNLSVGENTISPEFSKYNFGDYTITVPNDSTSVTLTFDMDKTTSSASFVRTRSTSISESRTGDTYTVTISNLPTDKTYYELNTVAENSEYTGKYTFIVNRIKNADSTLSSIVAKAGETTLTLDPDFNSSTYNYVVPVEAGVDTIELIPTVSVDTSSYYLPDGNSITLGDTKKRIIVTAEDGTYSIYNIVFRRPAFSDATLKAINVTGNDTNSYTIKTEDDNDFSPEVTKYNVVVPNTVTSIQLEGVKNNRLANVYGNGKYYLQTGLNDLMLTVTAEDGTVNYYYITVQREPNADASISYINGYYESENHSFVCSETTCELTVPYYIDYIDINYGFSARTTSGTFMNSELTQISKNKVSLVTGTNTYKLVTKAEDNTELTYTLNIEKEISTINTIDSIALKEAKIRYVDDNEYSAKVPFDIREVNFKIKLNDDAARYVISSNDSNITIDKDKVSGLSLGDNELLVTVYAEDGTPNIYIVTVTVLDEGSANNYLLSLTTNKGELVPTFSKTTYHYDVEVPYDITSITVNGRPEVEDEVSTITGFGTYNLNVGDNEIYVVVESIDGVERTYSITVVRNNSTDSSLKDLTINKTILNPGFDSEVFEYDITVDDNSIPFTSIVPTMSSSTYEIVGNEDLLTSGETYDVSIVVTAPNGINQSTYVIHAKRVTSTNAYLEDLSVQDYSIRPTFDSFKTTYTLTVPNDVTSVLVDAVAQNSNASIQGKGSKSLVPGDNFVNVIVTAEDTVTVKKYTICITRELSSNTNIEYIDILNGELKEEYSHTIDSYNVDVYADQDHLDFQIIFESPGTSYVVRNNYFEKNSIVYVDITAEDGTTRFLTFNVTVKPLISALLKSLEVDNYWFDTNFNSNIFKYTMTINYEDDYIDLSYVTVDSGATVSIPDTINDASINTTNKTIRFSNLPIGKKQVEIDVVDSLGESNCTYLIDITRNPYVDNFLEYLYHDYGDGEFNEDFNKLKYIYTLDVDKDCNEITLFGSAVTRYANVSVTTSNTIANNTNLTDKLGSYKLSKGKNEFIVNVTLNGYTRKYKVIVTRAFNIENDLLSLVVRNGRDYFDTIPEFTSSTKEYSVEVDEDVNSVTLAGDVSEGAIVSGLGKKNLNPGTNTFNIIVTSESGVSNVYTITITKHANNNAKLIDIIPSEGELNPPFGYETNEYELILDGSVSTLYFTVMTEEANATVSGNNEKLVPDGESVRVITVTAEDNVTTETYTINVSKVVSNDADLIDLKVRDYYFIKEDRPQEDAEFDKDVTEYFVIVDNTMKTIKSSDIYAKTSDDGATIIYSSETNISTSEFSEFVVSVLAEDKVTKKEYIINIKRKIGTSSKIKSVEPTIGYLETTFGDYSNDYVWITPKGKIESIEELGYILEDDGASVQIVLRNETYVIVVTSEDGNSTTTYTFTIKKGNNIYLNTLEVKDNTNTIYPLSPEFDSDINDYIVHGYVNAKKVTISAEANEEDYKVVMFDNLNNETISESSETYTITNDEENYTIQILDEENNPIVEYNVKLIKDILTDMNLESLRINDSDYVCEGSMCKIKPNFKPMLTTYKVDVPNAYERLDIGYTTMNEQQVVKFKMNDKYVENGEKLAVGSNLVQVEVYDGVKALTRTYNLTINRTKSGDANLDSLKVSSSESNEYTLTPEFDPDTLEYDIEVSPEITTVNVDAIAVDEEASFTINGYNYIQPGDNDVTITVLAADKKTSKTYIVHVYAGDPAKASFLKSISVSSGKFFDLNPNFKKSTTSYVVTTDSSTESVMIEATYDSTRNIKVVGEGEYNIFTGVNVFTLTSTLYESDNETVISSTIYTINVVRPLSSNVYLSDLKVTSSEETELLNEQGFYNLNKPFDKGTTEYGLTVSPGVSTLDIRYRLDDQKSRAVIYGNRLVTGTNYVDVVVFNEDETLTKTYQITVEVLPSTDSTLSAIKVYNTYQDEYENDYEEVYGVTAEDFEASEDNTYSIRVSYNIDKVILEGTPSKGSSLVIGNGTYYLEYGNNELSLYVEAEDGIHFSIYTVNVFREYNLFLSDILVDEESLEDFTKNEDTYSLTVTNDIKKMIFEGIPEEDNVTITYSIDSGSTELASITEDGILYTGVGLNKVLITVTAPDNTFKHYHVNVTREQSDNNYLEYLEFDEGIFREPFNKERQNYLMYILDTYTSLDLSKAQIIPEDATATYAVSGYAGLSKIATNTVTVAVTSESGKIRNYTIEVVLKPEAFFMHYLKTLRLSYKVGSETHEASLSPTFAQSTRNYTVTVPYSVSSISVNAIPLNDDDDAILTASTESGESLGDASYPLNFGRNVISIKVTSRLSNSDGSFGMYKVIVYRSLNATATLQTLAVTDHALSPSFNSNRTNYSVNIDSSLSKLDITAIPTDPGATVEITGNGKFHEGDNVITIKVTAADGKTIKNYYITAKCTLSDNNYLKDLSVKEFEIEPIFTKTNTGVYLANVDENVTNIYINAIKDDPDATIQIITSSNTYNDKNNISMNLMPGNNFVYFQVTSAAGNTRTYSLNVFRSYSTDNKLKNLVISDGELVPEFDPNETTYTVILEDDLAKLDNVSVIGFKNHNAATIKGNGEYALNPKGTTSVVITVTSQSGDDRKYTVNFVKKEAPSSKLRVLNVYEGELEPDFSSDGFSYYLTVPNEVTSLDLEVGTNVIPEDEEANVEITGNNDFKLGINPVTIKVTSTKGQTTTYNIYVTRSVLASNYLKELYIEGYDLTPTFNKTTLYYELDVASETDKVNLYAVLEDNDALIEIDGVQDILNKEMTLDYGDNKAYVSVTSKTGSKRVYTVNVIRAQNSEYYLLTLTTNVGTWDKPFNTETKEYVIDVPNEASIVTFTGTYSKGAFASGLGDVESKVGVNTHTIVITSESGLTNTYTFIINRPGKNETGIDSITSNRGDLTLEDNIYKISVPDSAASIIFTVTPHDPNATVVLDDYYRLDYGNNEIEIEVVAEDGETRKAYTINVFRNKDLASINIIKDVITLDIGEEEYIYYDLDPLDTNDREVTWSVLDDTIATINNGTVKALKNGITYVYLRSVTNPLIYDRVEINVSLKRISSSVYDVWHIDEEPNDLAEVDFSYVIGINDKTTLDTVLSNLDNDIKNLKVYSADTEITNYSNFAGSGMVIKLVINDKVYDEVVIVVRGDNGSVDSPGNGIITSTDYATLSSLLAGLTLKTPMTSLLYDLNKNKILTVTDLSPLSLYIAGKATFTNLNGL